MLAEYGWDKLETRWRCFSNPHTGELIEIEPGGPDTSGHFLLITSRNDAFDR